MKTNPDVDKYISGFPPKVRALMKTIRAAIFKALPDGEERLSYGIAGYFRDGAVAYFAAFKNHIGFFPPTHDPKLKKIAAKFAGAKGNLKFPLSALPPYELISKLVRARAAENGKKAAAKKAASKKPPKAPGKKSSAKKTSVKKSSAKKTSPKRTSTEKMPAKRSPAKKQSTNR